MCLRVVCIGDMECRKRQYNVMKLSMYIVEKLLVLLLVNHVNGDGMEFKVLVTNAECIRKGDC